MDEENKKLYIMMSIPGGGKSTKAKKLAPPEHILSTDSFHMVNGEYKWKSETMHIAHQWNQSSCEFFMKAGKTPLVIDNTNLSPKERKPYINLARFYGYDIEIVHPDSPWFLDVLPRLRTKTFTDEDVKLFAEKNVHSVPEEAIRRMMNNWNESE